MPIHFTCPHCGNVTDVAEQYAGQSGPCMQCGKTITVPPLGHAPLVYHQSPPKKPRSAVSTFLIILAICVPIFLFCGGILAALILPAVQAGREASRVANCHNNLRQIGSAVQAYYSANGHYPPAYVADKDGKPMHSWRVLILPYLGQQDLYNQYKMDEPWNSPHNRALSNRMPAIYRCPSENDTSNKTNYAMLVGPHAFSTGPKGRTRDEITDGPSNTIMIAETVGGNLNWLEPRDLDVETMGFDPVENPGKEISSNHRNTITVLFADGNVQSISKAADPDTIKSFTTIDGGEQATLEDTFSFE